MEIKITQDQILLMLLSGVVSWGVVQMIKPLIKNKFTKDTALGITRASALIVGSIAGFTLMQDPQGLWMGCAAGALNTVIVAKVKDRLKQ
jgi:hypothetical protein